MPKKNQSKSDEKDLSQNQKKPLPKLDPNLKQKVAYLRIRKDTGQRIKGSTETRGHRTAYKRTHKDDGKIKRHK